MDVNFYRIPKRLEKRLDRIQRQAQLWIKIGGVVAAISHKVSDFVIKKQRILTNKLITLLSDISKERGNLTHTSVIDSYFNATPAPERPALKDIPVYIQKGKNDIVQ